MRVLLRSAGPFLLILLFTGHVLPPCMADEMVPVFVPDRGSQEHLSTNTLPTPQIEWGTDYASAMAAAQGSGRAVLLFFTGSDWCHWCKRLKAEVFEQNAFMVYATSDLILVEVDSPRRRVLPEELVAKNEDLKQKFSIDSYPTVVLLNGEAQELGRSGYIHGGAKTFVRMLRSWRASEHR